MTACRLAIGWPAPYRLETGAAANSLNLDQANEAVWAAIPIWPDDGASSDTITHIGFRITTVGGTGAAAGSITMGFQGLTTGGVPDNTYSYSEAINAGAATGWLWFALTTGQSFNRGSFAIPVIRRNNSVADDTVNYVAANYQHQSMSQRGGVPYGGTANTTPVYAKAAGGYPTIALKSATKIYGLPATNPYASQSIGNTTEGGFIFSLPSSLVSTYKVGGVRLSGRVGVGSNTYTATIYENPLSGTIGRLQQLLQVDNDVAASIQSSGRLLEFYPSHDSGGSALSTLPTLSADTDYAFGFSGGASADYQLDTLQVASAGDKGAYSLQDDSFRYATRTLSSYPPDSDTNNFTESSSGLLIPWAELLLVDWTAPSGGGGGDTGGLVRFNGSFN